MGQPGEVICSNFTIGQMESGIIQRQSGSFLDSDREFGQVSFSIFPPDADSNEHKLVLNQRSLQFIPAFGRRLLRHSATFRDLFLDVV
jgi:hypothetical protein